MKRNRVKNGRRALAAVLGTGLLAAAIFAPGAGADDPTIDPLEPIASKSSRLIPRPAGTEEKLKFFYGPYVVPQGWDANRVDLDLPLNTGLVTAVEPGMRRVNDGTEPSHQEGHIHHSHWFRLDPGNEDDVYTDFTGNFGLTEWFFGNGDEETRADFSERSAADPDGPIYGGYIQGGSPQPLIYMLHNKTSKPMVVWIMLEVTMIHGTLEEIEAATGREHHDVHGVLFGRTYDVPRDRSSKDGTFETAEDDPRGVIEWTSSTDGTMIGTGGHLHPGGLSVTVENYGSEESPCPDDGGGYGGTKLLQSDALFRNGVKFSEDFQMEVTNPAWRAPIHKGDRIRISGVYENKKHGWYSVMTHEGIYIDEQQPPKGHCKPYLIGKAGRQARKMERKAARLMRTLRTKGASGAEKRITLRKVRRLQRLADPTEGVRNRTWGHHPTDLVCGIRFGAGKCDKPVKQTEPGMTTNNVSILNFQYLPGDLALSGQMGAPPRIKQGQQIRFVNLDQVLNIRHSVTTCKWPCNGRYVANYPLPDGLWDSGTLGYDVIDGGQPSPFAETPKDLKPGKYSYFCRIHPWMRGAFEVTK